MRRVQILAAISILTSGSVEASAPGDANGPVSMEAYSQTILVTFKSEEAARRAHLHIAPLFHDLRAAFMAGRPPETSYSVPWVGSIAWKVLAPARAAILDPDIIPTSGRANTPDNYPSDFSIYFPYKNAYYLLYGRIVSPRAQTVHAVFSRAGVKALSLNGLRVDGGQLDLRKGGNDVRILYAPSRGAASTYIEENYGCYLRLTESDGSRVEGVRFERPDRP